MQEKTNTSVPAERNSDGRSHTSPYEVTTNTKPDKAKPLQLVISDGLRLYLADVFTALIDDDEADPDKTMPTALDSRCHGQGKGLQAILDFLAVDYSKNISTVE